MGSQLLSGCVLAMLTFTHGPTECHRSTEQINCPEGRGALSVIGLTRCIRQELIRPNIGRCAMPMVITDWINGRRLLGASVNEVQNNAL